MGAAGATDESPGELTVATNAVNEATVSESTGQHA